MRPKIDKTRICELINCDNVFQYKRKEQRFCSRNCVKINAQSRVTRTCKLNTCNNKFEVQLNDSKSFCGRSCSATYNNLAKTTSKNCLGCSKELQGRNQKKYCSAECGTAFRSRENIRKWLSGEWNATTSTGLSYPIGQYLKEQAGWRCQSPDCCVIGGWSVVNIKTGTVPVEIDHIDGNCYNNKPENLIVLCPNCHAITDTYKALNKNSGRTYRSKYKQFV